MQALKALSDYRKVDVYGQAVGRPVPSKWAIARDYRFMFCFENATIPGYVTEKPLHAWLAGCLPLWRGNDAAGLINPLSLVNAAEFLSVTDFVEFVSILDQDDAAMQNMYEQPLFRSEPTLQPLRLAIAETLGLAPIRR